MKIEVRDVKTIREFKLCYIEGDDAYFTTAPITGENAQWGGNWGNAPYEHNAGTPYEWREGSRIPRHELLHIKWVGFWDMPHEQWHAGSPCNSPYSVENINSGVVPWLRGWGQEIWAGTDLSTFIRMVEDSGGTIWFERKRETAPSSC